MAIKFLEERKMFLLETEKAHYSFYLYNGCLRSGYWGKKLRHPEDIHQWSYEINKTIGSGFVNTDLCYAEFTPWGTKFYNEPTLKLSFQDGVRDLQMVYESHEINDAADTLTVTMKDIHYNLYVDLVYKIYDGLDIVDRHLVVRNKTGEKVVIDTVNSATVNLPYLDNRFYRLTSMGSGWMQEYEIARTPITKAATVIQSRAGVSNSTNMPYFAIDEGAATENEGDVWFGALKWSGNFKITVELDTRKTVKVTGGVNDFDFSYILKDGDSFTAPVFTFGFAADTGFSGASRQLHEYTRNYQYGGYWADKCLPIIYNAWPTFWFDINEEKLSALAERAAELGVELFVIDDGWFSTRNNELSGLGDWYPSPEKFPNGLNPLIKKVNDLGMKFGLWVEPEMVNPQSELYKNHPDWVLNFPTREREMQRNQLVLNLARDDVYEFIIGFLDDLLSNHNIEYLKWDMNRWFSQPGWPEVAPEEQQSMWVKYVWNFHRVFQHIRDNYPMVIIENCASGGLRSDLAMSQWCSRINRSDNQDPVDMLYMHEGFTYVNLSRSAGGAGHISPKNAYINERDCPMEFKAHVGMLGSLATGMDLRKMTDEEIEEMKGYFEQHKQIRHIVQLGDMYRIASIRDGDHAIYEYVSKDKKEMLLFVFGIARTFRLGYENIKLHGLDEDTIYFCDTGSKEYGNIRMSGDGLMKIGVPTWVHTIGNMRSAIYHFKAEE